MAPPGALPANVERIDSLGGITQFRLRSNGMKILLSPNHAAPVITFLVVYHVGSRNEAPGNTGSAHLLEHMLFNKSTQNFGRANGHKTFQEVLYEAGADFSSTNMTTWNDRMTGYSTLPEEDLDLAMRIEADRMSRALVLDEERKPEMSVVINEYEIGENNPYRALEKSVVASCIVAHPYHWATIGYRSDLEGVPTEKLREHYRNFFWPDNAEAILVGDFDPVDALRIFDREFGALAKSKTPIPTVITVEPPQEGERRVVVNRPGEVGIVELAYLRPGSLHPDFIPLDLLSAILSSGVNSRLYQALVETGLATDIRASNYALRDPYPILVTATVAPTATHEKVEAALKAVLRDVAEKGVTAEELARAKRRLEVSVIRGRDGTYELASSLGEAVASANWRWFVTYLDSMRLVTTADIERVAQKYFVPEHATVGWFIPIRNNPPPTKSAPAAKKSPRTKRPGAGGAYAAESGPGATFADRTFHRILRNGITLNVVANAAVPTVAVHGLALAGRQEAPVGKPAVPQLTAAMLTRGTQTRDKRAIAALLDGVGASISINADLTEAPILGAALSKDTRLLLSVLADELKNPAFAPGELAKAKSELKADLLRGYESTSLRARERLSRLAFPKGHPYRAADREEMLASLDAATVADLRAFHHDRYVGSGIILSIVGDVDPAAVASLVDSLFSPIPAGGRPRYDIPRTEPNSPGLAVETMRGKANMNFVFGEASGLRRMDPDWEAAIVANAALGQSSLTSRIGKRVRDQEGLSYTLNSRFLWSDYLDGVWMVDVAVAPKNLAKALRSTREEIDRYCKEGITEEEVATQRRFFAGNYRVRLSTNAGIAFALTSAEKYGYGPAYLDQFPVKVGSVTREQVNQVIQTRLRPDKLHLVVAGDLDTIPDF